MTVHSAKGLEFKNVFVVGLEENLFPSDGRRFSPGTGRRTPFVLCSYYSRGGALLSVFCQNRFRYGKMEFGSPSRFLRDIDVHYLQLPHEEE